MNKKKIKESHIYMNMQLYMHKHEWRHQFQFKSINIISVTILVDSVFSISNSSMKIIICHYVDWLSSIVQHSTFESPFSFHSIPFQLNVMYAIHANRTTSNIHTKNRKSNTSYSVSENSIELNEIKEKWEICKIVSKSWQTPFRKSSIRHIILLDNSNVTICDAKYIPYQFTHSQLKMPYDIMHYANKNSFRQQPNCLILPFLFCFLFFSSIQKYNYKF